MDRLTQIVDEIAQQPDINSIKSAAQDALGTPRNQAHTWLLEQLVRFLRNPNYASLCSDDVLRRIKPVARKLVLIGALSAEDFDACRFSDLPDHPA